MTANQVPSISHRADLVRKTGLARLPSLSHVRLLKIAAFQLVALAAAGCTHIQQMSESRPNSVCRVEVLEDGSVNVDGQTFNMDERHAAALANSCAQVRVVPRENTPYEETATVLNQVRQAGAKRISLVGMGNSDPTGGI